MNIQVQRIDEYLNQLKTNVSMKLNYLSFKNSCARILIVEGQTDKAFIEKIRDGSVECLIANKAFETTDKSKESHFNSKEAIIQVVCGMEKFSMVLKVPQELNAFHIYGMVDLDYDSPQEAYYSASKLFVTDTHDLETLILSTDSEVLHRLEDCILTDEDIKKALTLAYQLALTREIIEREFVPGLDTTWINGGGEKEIDYDCIITDNHIDISKLINYLNDKSNNLLSSAKKKKLCEKVVSDKRLKKKLDKNKEWKDSWEKTEISDCPEIWEMVNGHDILSVLRYISKSAADKYNNKGSYRLNRDFEFDIIGNYDYLALRTTKLYEDMVKENVVKDIDHLNVS